MGASSYLRVLLAESGFSETGLTLRSLCADTGRTLELFFVTNRDSLPTALSSFRPDISLLALSLLHPDPPAAIHSLHQSVPDIPLILFADPADKEIAVSCLQVGATDYILEGHMDVRTLDRVLQSALRSDLPAAPAPASLNPLTGLPDCLAPSHDPNPARASDSSAASHLLLSVHLTNYEFLRGVAGPHAADGALQRVALHLQKCVRRCDRIAHVAPDKFVVFVADATDSALVSIHRRITTSLSLQNQFFAGALPLSLSILSEPWPSPPTTVPQMICQPSPPQTVSASAALPFSTEISRSWG